MGVLHGVPLLGSSMGMGDPLLGSSMQSSMGILHGEFSIGILYWDSMGILMRILYEDPLWEMFHGDPV